MHQVLFHLPIPLAALLAGALIGISVFGNAKRKLFVVMTGLVGGAAAAAFAYSRWGVQSVPVRGYGTMILAGFLLGVWMAARRARLLGMEPRHCVDVGIYGVFLGLAGARLFHICMHASQYNPFQPGGFDFGRILDMFRVWEGGLVFYGAFVVVVPWAWAYCRYHKLPALPFLDLAAPSLIAGLAVGRLGCFLNGCCYGKVSDLPWAVSFPQHSGELDAFTPPYHWQVDAGLLQGSEPATLPIHPTQLYAALGAALIAGFLYALWPRRRFDGQILSLMLILAGASRFFEELLRSDEPAAFPELSLWMTIAQYVAIGLVLLGTGMLLYFRQRRTLTPQTA